MAVKFYLPENQVPLEMHKVRVVQKLSLHPVEERKNLMQEAGNNTFLLHNKDIYMDNDAGRRRLRRFGIVLSLCARR